MYSQFLSGQSFSPVETPPAPSAPCPPGSAEGAPSPDRSARSDVLGELTGSLQGLLGGLFQQFSPEKLDTGDLLLALILLFLFLEGDNLELVITLGLLLLLGLGED